MRTTPATAPCSVEPISAAPRRVFRLRLLSAAGAVAAALSLLSVGQTQAAGMTGHMVKQTKVAGAYRLVLQIGPAETMGKHGSEMTMHGQMATCTMPGQGGMKMSSGSMSTTTCNRHVELHVYNAHTGKVITNANVTIAMLDGKKHMTIKIPIMTMMGSQGMSDFHYGNNVYAGAGTYTVTVTVNRTHAAFTVNLM